MVQRSVIPLPGEMERLIAESRARPPVAGVVHPDIVYARSLLHSERLDVYEPLAVSNRPPPVVIFLHGGSWIHGDKVTIRIVDRFLTRMRAAGYFVIAVNYTTSVLRGLGGPLQNVKSAIRWVAGHADEFGYDSDNIGLYGVSAGGHLALMAASEMVPSGFRFAFVFAECAPSDLIALRNGEAFDHSRFLAVFPKRVLEKMSPVRLVGDQLPPVLLFHGGADRVVSIEQSKRFARAAADAGIHVETAWYPDGDHGFLNLPDEVWYEQETRALRFFSDQFHWPAGHRSAPQE